MDSGETDALIERLNEIQRGEFPASKGSFILYAKDVAREAAAEIARYREALEKIVKLESDCSAQGFMIARTALERMT